jgi:hypothetical protein
LIGPLEACAELTACVIVEERRGARAARQRSFFETEHEHDLVPARTRAEQVDDCHSPLLARRGAHLRPLERGDHVVGGHLLACERPERLQLVEQAQRSVVRAQVEP